MVAEVPLAPLLVLQLKVLVTREVIREKMDYKDCLGGKAREELDRLARFEGKFFIDTLSWRHCGKAKNYQKKSGSIGSQGCQLV